MLWGMCSRALVIVITCPGRIYPVHPGGRWELWERTVRNPGIPHVSYGLETFIGDSTEFRYTCAFTEQMQTSGHAVQPQPPSQPQEEGDSTCTWSGVPHITDLEGLSISRRTVRAVIFFCAKFMMCPSAPPCVKSLDGERQLKLLWLRISMACVPVSRT